MRSWWPGLVSFLLLGIVFSLLFGGYRSYMAYTKAVDPGLPLNSATLRFFTKEYLQRKYFRFTTSPQPVQTEFPSFHIFADEQDLESLESDLPASGKTRFISGHIQVDKPSFSSEMSFRFRGGLPLHWFYKKKSLRIKLPPYITYRGERQFNLVNPSLIQTITDWISYDMSRTLGLLTPDYFPARVYINNVTNGVHYFLSRIDESFLRKNQRMPGSIYSGDTIYVPNPFGADERSFETVFKDDDGLPRMWIDERLWDKGAARNTESKNDRRDIQKFIEILNQESPDEFMRLFESYFDKEKYYLYWGLDTLVGSYHHDLFHNHKMYFDPYKGKFEPIEWDIRYWTSIFQIKDIVLHPLLRRVKLNPILEHERDLVTYSLMDRFPVEDLIVKIDQANQQIRGEVAADPLRHAPDHRYGRFTQDKEMPYSIDEYDDAIEELKLSYRYRHAYLNKVLNFSQASYNLKRTGVDQVIATVSVTGNSAIEFNPFNLIPPEFQSQANVFRLHGNTTKAVSRGKPEILYPGRSISKGNIFNRFDTRSILGYGKDKLMLSPIHYRYLIKGVNFSFIQDVGDVNITNAITGNSMRLLSVAELPSDDKTFSVHPWDLSLDRQQGNPPELLLSGVINISKDMVYPKWQKVKILPGTIFSLAKGKSLVFYGQVIAEGTQASPIVFKQAKKGEPWGSIVIQGKDAADSRLQYIQVSGGSVSRHHLIDYPGQLNIHDVDSFTLSHCLIQSNHIGDDALHVAYSVGEISSCRFEDTAFDALDMDISRVSVSDSEFFNIGNDALDLMTSNISIRNVSIKGAGDKCVSIGEDSDVTINESRLRQCEVGIAIKDQSRAFIEDIYFAEIKQQPIALYQKNPRYGKGGTIDGRQLFGITEKDVHLDQGSISLIPSHAFDG